jgi:uncharacterized linocin/CFP29 family protein
MSTPASIDVVQTTQAGSSSLGPVAMRLMQSGFNVNSLRLNADIHAQGILRKEEWIHFDNAVIPVARQRLVGIGDLMSRGLTMGIPGALGVTRVEWERISDMDPAVISMSGVVDGGNDRVVYDLEGIPLPIVHRDFFLNIRALEASRRSGTPLDTTQAQLAAKLVSEKVESILYAGANIVGSANQIYGLTNHPNRNTGSVTASWLTATGEQIVTDINLMIASAISDNMFGPFVLHIPIAVDNKLDNDFKVNSDITIRERILKIPSILKILASANLTTSNVVLVQVTPDVIDVLDGIQPTVVMWDTMGGMQVNFKVMAIIVPRIKATYTNQSGLVHYS